LGTVRVAVVRGNRAALAEVCRAVTDVRVERAGKRAALHIRAKARTAARLNERVNTAKMNRSNLRLRTLNAAIAKEEKRLAAQGRLSATLTLRKEGRWEEAKTFAVRVRRAAAMERLITRGAELQKRCLDAASRREALLSAIVARAAVRCLSSLALQRAAARDAKTTVADTTVKEATEEKAKEVIPAVVKPTEAKIETKAAVKGQARPIEGESEVKAPTGLKAIESLPTIDLDARIAELRLLLEKRLTSDAAKSEAEGGAPGLAEQRTALMKKAAAVSTEGAAKAEARAEAKRAARTTAQEVKASVNKAAAMAGLHGRDAKSREAVDAVVNIPSTATSAPSSAPSSVAASDSEEWHVVAGQSFMVAD